MITPDNSAEAQLQQELREMFLLDTQQQLETYFDIIQRLNPESWIGDIQSIYRAIHTIKGGAVTVEANSMLHAAMVLEDLLSDLRYLAVPPPLNDGKLSKMLLEAGELLASCLEISSPGIEPGSYTNVEDGNRVQLTIGRLQILHVQVKEQYLPDWNEMKQVHQEFADQGFDLVILDLEMELANIPVQGTVPKQIIEIAQATIDQLTQIGVELELASGWLVLIQFCDLLISNPDSQLWRAVWLPYFAALKACVKNSGEIGADEIDRLEQLQNAAQIADPISINQVVVEDDADLPNLLDDFFLDEEPLLENEIITAADESVPAITSDDSIAVVDRVPEITAEDDGDLPDLLDDFFLDEEPLLENEIITAVDESVQSIISADSIAVVDRVAVGIAEDDGDLPDLLDDFFLDEEPFLETEIITGVDESVPAITSDDSIAVVDQVAAITAEDDDLPDLLDNFFLDEEPLLETEIITATDESVQSIISDGSIGVVDRVPAITAEDDGDLPDLLDNFFLDEEIDLESEQSIGSFNSEQLDDFDQLSQIDDAELIELIENDLVAVSEPVSIDLAPSSIPQIDTTPVEVKRGISIPVPLERLDRSAQHVVDTLLTARAVRNVSSRLQLQLSQLSILTQESSQFVTKLRQLQDDYALLRSLNDDRDSTSNVTTERYRQGYTTIVRLLENILRMSELGQEIETATYQNHHHLDDLDRSIMRLKDGIETSRLVPFRNLTLRAKAILRDLTNRYGKPAELLVQNEQVELDAGIVQQLEPALLHLLRNAYDHGLESVGQRLAAGKPACGTIYVSLQRRGNLYRLEVGDDGGGIDADEIGQIAKSKGFPIYNTRTNKELLAVICQPGFSSSSSVSEVSGRGVGMDVVVAQLATIGGKLSLETAIGHGTQFIIEVPAPQLLVPCVLFQVGERTVAFPTEEVLETALLSSLAAKMSADDQVGMCAWTLTTARGEVSGFDLANYWQFAHRMPSDTAVGIRTRQGAEGGEIWSIADDLLGQAELLINPLPSPLIAPVGLLGVSLQSDGRLISILDPIALTNLLSSRSDRDLDYSFSTLAVEQTKPSAPTILIVDDAALMRRRFEASLTTSGFITHTCNDGLEALNWLQTNPSPDLMITDVEMPNMDGFTLIDRARQSNIQIPILVVSSRLSEEWGKEARRLGATDYLNKGFSTPELLQKVNDLLGLLMNA